MIIQIKLDFRLTSNFTTIVIEPTIIVEQEEGHLYWNKYTAL